MPNECTRAVPTQRYEVYLCSPQFVGMLQSHAPSIRVQPAIVDNHTGILIDGECPQPRLPMISDPFTADYLTRLREFPFLPITT
jgi:hypothetical protein